MKAVILFVILSSAVCLSCTNKQQKFQPEATPDKELAIIGGGDTATSIQISSANHDTIIYDTPECDLWYVTELLSDEYKDKPISMWTEHPIYEENVQTINVFVANPSSTPLMYGRGWVVEQWNGKEWVTAETKGDRSWHDDGFCKQKAPLLYCFRLPIGRIYHLPKGKYRINKPFYAGKERIELTAAFEIQSVKHRENGWYRIMDEQKDSIASQPIVTVKEFASLRLAKDNSGKAVITGSVSKHKLQAWADSTEQLIGKRMGFVFNDAVITAPRVTMRLESGAFLITTSQTYDIPSLYRSLLKEKKDSLDALFKAHGWEVDTLFFNLSEPKKQDSIINSLDYFDALAIVKGFGNN